MRSRSPWLVLALLIGVGAVLVAFTQAGPADSPEHSSTSDGRNGTSALRQFAESLGRPSGAVEGEFRLPDRPFQRHRGGRTDAVGRNRRDGHLHRRAR